MSYYKVQGKTKLYGEVNVGCAKNSVLPLIAACMMIKNKVLLKNVNPIGDVNVMCEIFKSLGGSCEIQDGNLLLDGSNIDKFIMPDYLTGKIRASFFSVGALLSVFGRVKIKKPGGCDIGARPVDIHVACLRQLGVKVYEEQSSYYFEKTRCGGDDVVRLPYPSVGATENLILASAIKDGTTLIRNCAKEPEIVDLQNFLNKCGAKIKGAGSGEIFIDGVKSFATCQIEYEPVSDRIEAGTYVLAGCACGGEIAVNNISIDLINILLKNIRNNACKITANNDKIIVQSGIGGFPARFIRTGPYPMFPTDLQPQFVAAMLTRDDFSIIEEDVFEKRFSYVEELRKLGGNIEIIGNRAIVGKSSLHGAEIKCADLRGGSALVIASMCAEGNSVIRDIEHIERGYFDFDKKLSLLGAKIEKCED